MANTDYLTAVVALAFVVGLIALLGWAIRRFGLIPGASAVIRGGRRIKIVEVTPIDVRRKLVLIRRDRSRASGSVGRTTRPGRSRPASRPVRPPPRPPSPSPTA